MKGRPATPRTDADREVHSPAHASSDAPSVAPLPGLDPLGRRLLIGIILFSSAITLLVTAAQVYRDYDGDMARIESSAGLVASSYVPTLVNSLWHVDDEQTQILVDGIATLNDVERVQVLSAEGREVGVGQVTSKRRLERRFELRHATGVELGELVVTFSVDRVLERLLDRAVFVLLGNALKTFLVAGFALTLFYRLVSRHLSAMASYSSSVDAERNRPRPFVLDRGERPAARHDTLDVLASSLNDMIARVVRSRESLEESEQRYRDIVEGSLQGIVIQDAHSIRYANRSAREILGYESVEDLRTRFDVADLACDAEGPTVAERHRGWLDGSLEPERFDAVHGRRDGTEVALEVFPRVVGGASARAVQLTFVDVTARQTAERELVAHQAELESIVEERTRALERAHEELLAAERLATMGQMTATVSHELRNPLGTLGASVEVLRRRLVEPDDYARRALERIERNVARCTTIIDELLGFARSPRVLLRPVEVGPWLEQVVDELPNDDGVTLTVERGSLGMMTADPERLRQCVRNLVQNARQSIREHGDDGRVVVRASENAGRLEISVADSGPGVAPELRERIFEPLFTTRGFGVGLGLPVVRRVMAEHGGGDEFVTSDGGGARFTLWLPSSTAPGVAATSSGPPASE